MTEDRPNPHRRARQLVLESLYESEMADHSAEDALGRRVAELKEEGDPGADRMRRLGKKKLNGVMERLDEIDEMIAWAAPKHPVETMAPVDRNVLRVALWELLSDNPAPVGVIVNEAVELARTYGSESSVSFVNGVLRTLSERISTQQPSD